MERLQQALIKTNAQLQDPNSKVSEMIHDQKFVGEVRKLELICKGFSERAVLRRYDKGRAGLLNQKAEIEDKLADKDRCPSTKVYLRSEKSDIEDKVKKLDVTARALELEFKTSLTMALKFRAREDHAELCEELAKVNEDLAKRNMPEFKKIVWRRRKNDLENRLLDVDKRMSKLEADEPELEHRLRKIRAEAGHESIGTVGKDGSPGLELRRGLRKDRARAKTVAERFKEEGLLRPKKYSYDHPPAYEMTEELVALFRKYRIDTARANAQLDSEAKIEKAPALADTCLNANTTTGRTPPAVNDCSGAICCKSTHLAKTAAVRDDGKTELSKKHEEVRGLLGQQDHGGRWLSVCLLMGLLLHGATR